jgi:hypothetical protein
MFRVKQAAAAAAAIVSLAVWVMAPASPATADYLTGDSQRVGYESWSSSKCMDVSEGRTDNGAPITIWDCYNTWNEYFFVQAVGYDNLKREPIVVIEAPVAATPGSGSWDNAKCLSVNGWSTTPGAPVLSWDCVPVASQEWYVEHLLDSSAVRFQNVNSGQYLSVSGEGTANATPILQWPDNFLNGGHLNQLFFPVSLTG